MIDQFETTHGSVLLFDRTCTIEPAEMKLPASLVEFKSPIMNTNGDCLIYRHAPTVRLFLLERGAVWEDTRDAEKREWNALPDWVKSDLMELALRRIKDRLKPNQ